MPFDPISIGTAPNDGQGDPLRTAMDKSNGMFEELYATMAAFAAALGVGTGVGNLVTLPFEVIAPDTAIAGAFTFDLPRLPGDFTLADCWLTCSRRTDGAGAVTMNAELKQGGVNAATLSGLVLPSSGVINMAVVAAGGILASGVSLQLVTNVVDGEGVYGVSQGLTLWLRGTWNN